MKIFIVTKGSYSDYHIIACFVNKDQAEKCALMYSDRYEDAYVDEYDTKDYDFISDEKQCTLTAEIDTSPIFKNINSAAHCVIKGPFNLKSIKNCDEHVSFNSDEYITVETYGDGGCEIRIKKNYSYERFTDESASEHFQKFIYDLIAQLKSYILDGADERTIGRLLEWRKK